MYFYCNNNFLCIRERELFPFAQSSQRLWGSSGQSPSQPFSVSGGVLCDETRTPARETRVVTGARYVENIPRFSLVVVSPK